MDESLSQDDSDVSVRRIQKLPSELINQIAAGEVVERPSTLIKELVENSLDAGATRIETYLIEGGLAELTVVDNGCGIEEGDLPLAVERHTTSKLTKISDLENISTYGFRGEALSSIASVSDFIIRSRPKGSTRGMSLHIPFGENPELKPVGCPEGTQVSVKSLFSKIPARFKFLRSQTTELSHSLKTLKELALGNPEVSFFIHHNGRLLSKYTSSARLARFKECLKPEWEPIHLTDSIDEMTYETLLSPLEHSQERGEIILFINQRPVKNRLLVSAIRTSYQEALGTHLEPSGVFYLDIRGDWVDVNVHPQKLEVRFYRQEKIYSWLISSLRKLLPRTAPHPVFPPMTTESSATMGGIPASSLPFKVIGNLGANLLLVESPSGLLILNRIALDKRNLFKHFQDSLESGMPTPRSLAVAQILSLSNPQWQHIQRLIPFFNKLGFQLELFGDKDIAVKAVPSFCPEFNPKALIGPLLSELAPSVTSGDEEKIKELILKKLATLIINNQVFGPLTETIRYSDRDLSLLNESWTCPEGNPVLLKLSWEQLEKHFKQL